MELREAAAQFLGKCGSKEIPEHLEVGGKSHLVTYWRCGDARVKFSVSVPVRDPQTSNQFVNIYCMKCPQNLWNQSIKIRIWVSPHCNPFSVITIVSCPHFAVNASHLTRTVLQNQTIFLEFPLSLISINLPAFCHKCCNLIGYATRYLFRDSE